MKRNSFKISYSLRKLRSFVVLNHLNPRLNHYLESTSAYLDRYLHSHHCYLSLSGDFTIKEPMEFMRVKGDSWNYFDCHIFFWLFSNSIKIK